MKYQVVVTKVSDSDVDMVAGLRTITPNFSLKHALEIRNYLANNGNSVLAAGLTEDVVSHIAKNLKASGAEVSVDESSINTPMVCLPELTKKYKWNSVRQVVETR